MDAVSSTLPSRGPESVSQDRPFVEEWDLFCREAPRLLAEGHEGKWALLKDGQFLGLFDTDRQAMNEGYRRSARGFEPFLVK
jgi:hypothetical protein